MYKTILGLNPLRERDLTPSGLWRLRVSSVMAIIAMPIYTLLDKFNAFDRVSPLVTLVMICAVILSLVPLGFSRMNSLFTRSRKHLDEWEITARLNAESFTYRSVGAILVLILLSLALNADLHTVRFQGKDALYVFGNLVLLCVTLPAAYTAWKQKPLQVH